MMLVHKQPELVRRAVHRLLPNPVLVHVDAKAKDSVYGPLAELEEEGMIRLLPRIRCGWASWGLVEATLLGMERALETGATHVVSMTGQCYPLWPGKALAEFVSSRPDVSWMGHSPIPVPRTAIGDGDGGVGRITKWHLTVRGRHLRVPIRRSLPAGLAPHYGQMQWCLSAPLVRWVVEEMGRRPELRRYFRRTQAPDELLIPTVALSSPMAADVSGENLWYADWRAGGSHPRVLAAQDFEDMALHARQGGDMNGRSSVKMFARKLDARLSRDLLDRIDRELLGAQP